MNLITSISRVWIRQIIPYGQSIFVTAPVWVLEEVFSPLVSQIGFREEHRIDVRATLDGFSDYRDFPNITRGLVSRGYSDEEIEGILGENFLRVWETVCG